MCGHIGPFDPRDLLEVAFGSPGVEGEHGLAAHRCEHAVELRAVTGGAVRGALDSDLLDREQRRRQQRQRTHHHHDDTGDGSHPDEAAAAAFLAYRGAPFTHPRVHRPLRQRHSVERTARIEFIADDDGRRLRKASGTIGEAEPFGRRHLARIEALGGRDGLVEVHRVGQFGGRDDDGGPRWRRR